MDESMNVGLDEEIFADLSEELKISDPNFNSNLLLSKVKNAMREVKKARKYPAYYTEEQINRDMCEYYSNVRNIALYDYNSIGGEGEQSHSENGVSRSYIDRNKLFAGIVPLSRF